MSLLVVGSLGLDTVETPFGRVKDVIGGTAVYFGVGASYFAPVRLVGVVGDDFPAAELQFMRDRNIDLQGLVIKPGKSFRWGGKYSLDLNHRDTLFTELNVFETFNPELPASYRESPIAFLGNIMPRLQLNVLNQMSQPRLVALDTMNYWIERTPEDLAEVLKRIDIIFINDSEARQLARHHNLIKAGKIIHDMGPRIIVIKKGEHGALMMMNDQVFCAPAFPVEEVFDPTGAGDTFAGGFMGYLAKAGKADEDTLRQAVIYGSTFASFVVERFSLDRIRNLSNQEIFQRFEDFHQMTCFAKPSS